MIKKIKIDENGYTLQKIILLSVLVLAAAGASILIYNAIAGKSGDVAATSASLSELLKNETDDKDSRLSEEQVLFKEENPELWQLLVFHPYDSLFDSFNCVLHNNDMLSCWGTNRSGELGNGETHILSGSIDLYTGTKYTGIVKVKNINDVKEVSLGLFHACVMHNDETVSCWGHNRDSTLGFASDDPHSNLPLKMVDADNNPLSNVKAISAGGDFTCAVLSDGTISCWGVSDAGQLGDGIDYKPPNEEDVERRPTPYSSSKKFVKVLDINDAVGISAGESHACALHEDTTISCWGQNSFGELGNGVMGERSNRYRQLSPVKVKNSDNTIASGFISVKVGARITCGLHSDETVSCWGTNIWSSHGKSLYDQHSSLPVKVVDSNRNPINDVKSIVVGFKYACALHNDGTITCWGIGLFEKVTGVNDVTAIIGRAKNLCALHRDETVSCWGDNTYGQVSNSSLVRSVKSLGN